MTRAKQNSTQHGQSAARLSVTIETPKESRNKLKFDPGTRQFKLSKVMPEGMMFPYDFGFVPSTKGEDGDPLDVLVLTDAPLFPGCQVECRVLGVIKGDQKEKKGKKVRNDRFIAVATASTTFEELKSLKDMNEKILDDCISFFEYY